MVLRRRNHETNQFYSRGRGDTLAGAVRLGAYRVYQSFTTKDDPLRAEKIELQRAEILRETEEERQETEKQKRKTAKTLAAIDRQAKLDSNQGVNFAAVTLAVTWRMTFPLLLFSGLLGGGVYLWRKPVLFEFEGVLTREQAPENDRRLKKACLRRGGFRLGIESKKAKFWKW